MNTLTISSLNQTLINNSSQQDDFILKIIHKYEENLSYKQKIILSLCHQLQQEMINRQAQVQTYRQQIRQFQKTYYKGQKNTQFQSNSRQIYTLNNKLKDLEFQCQELKSQCDSKVKLYEQTIKKVGDLNIQSILKEKKIKNQENLLKKSNQQNQKLKSGVLNLQLIMNCLRKKYQHFEQKVQEQKLGFKMEELRIDTTQFNNIKQDLQLKQNESQICLIQNWSRIYQLLNLVLRDLKARKQQIIQLKIKLDKSEKQKKQLQKQKQIISNDYLSIQRNVQQFKSIFDSNKLNSFSQYLSFYIQQLQKAMKKPQSSNSKLFQSIQKLSKFLEKVKDNHQINENMVNQIRIQKDQISYLCEKKQNQINTLTKKQIQQKRKADQMQINLKAKNQQINQLKLKITANQKKNSQLSQEIKLNQQKYQVLKMQLTSKLAIKTNQINDLQKKQQDLLKINNSLNEEKQKIMKSLQINKGALTKQLSQLSSKKKTLQSDLFDSKRKNQQLEQQKRNLDKKLKQNQQQYDARISKKQSQLSNAIDSLSQISFLLTGNKVQMNFHYSQHFINEIKSYILDLKNFTPFLCQSSILDFKRDKSSINFIKNSVQNFKNCKVSGCQLVYRKDQHKSNVNFHEYFDEVQNLLLIVHLANNRIIGGFTSKPFIKNNTQKPGEGFLFVADTQSIYFMKPDGKQAITYDEYFIIWGNSEIRIRFGQDLLFSNFGILNSYYDNKKEKIQNFLGFDNQREISMSSYELYKVKL